MVFKEETKKNIRNSRAMMEADLGQKWSEMEELYRIIGDPIEFIEFVSSLNGADVFSIKCKALIAMQINYNILKRIAGKEIGEKRNENND